jgi:hypothetical protein
LRRLALVGKGDGRGQVMVCDVVSGNVYPVIEEPLDAAAAAALPTDDGRRRLGSLLGRPAVPKYEAHFAVVEVESKVARPCLCQPAGPGREPTMDKRAGAP